MKVGDLVKCRYFHRFGVVTSRPEHNVRNGGAYVDEVVWVMWARGDHTKYKVEYLEVVNGTED